MLEASINSGQMIVGILGTYIPGFSVYDYEDYLPDQKAHIQIANEARRLQRNGNYKLALYHSFAAWECATPDQANRYAYEHLSMAREFIKRTQLSEAEAEIMAAAAIVKSGYAQNANTKYGKYLADQAATALDSLPATKPESALAVTQWLLQQSTGRLYFSRLIRQKISLWQANV